jgi:hypothetical protein
MVMDKKIVDTNKKQGVAEQAAPSSFNEDEAIKAQMTFKLSRPFKYDGEEITEIDMSAMLDLSASDLVQIDREMSRLGYTGTRQELTRQYAMLVAAKCMHKPGDFCDGMDARDSIRLKEYVVTFFYATV